MKTIVLAGGTGTRLGMITKAVNKQLLPIGGKPLICHVLDMAAQVSSEVLVICNPEDMSSFAKLTEDYNTVNIFFRNQNHPDGIASAIALGEAFCQDEDVLVLLGDNIFSKDNTEHIIDTIKHVVPKPYRTYHRMFDTSGLKPTPVLTPQSPFRGAHVWTIKHESPENYGVLVVNDYEAEKVIEKPDPSLGAGDQAVVGCYLLDNRVWDLLPHLKKSARGEFEIADLLNMYAEDGMLNYSELLAGGWYDIGASTASYHKIATLFQEKEVNETK